MEVGSQYFSGEEQIQASMDFNSFSDIQHAPDTGRPFQAQTPEYNERYGSDEKLKTQIPQLQMQKIDQQRFKIYHPSFDMNNKLDQGDHDVVQQTDDSSFEISETNENTTRQQLSCFDRNLQLQLSNGSKLVSSQSQGLSEQLSNMKIDLQRMQQENFDIKSKLSSEKPILVQDYLQSLRQNQGSNNKENLNKNQGVAPQIALLIEEFHSQKQQLQETIEKKNQQIRKENEIYKQLKVGFEASIVQVKQLQVEVQLVQKEKQDLQQKVQKKQNQLLEFQQQLDRLADENRKIQDENRRYQDDNRRLAEENRRLLQSQHYQQQQLYQPQPIKSQSLFNPKSIEARFDAIQDISHDEEDQVEFYKDQLTMKEADLQGEKDKNKYQNQRIQNLLEEIKQLEIIIKDKDIFVKTMQDSYETEKAQFQLKLQRYQKSLQKLTSDTMEPQKQTKVASEYPVKMSSRFPY